MNSLHLHFFFAAFYAQTYVGNLQLDGMHVKLCRVWQKKNNNAYWTNFLVLFCDAVVFFVEMHKIRLGMQHGFIA